mgnify:CR=1 FL=1
MLQGQTTGVLSGTVGGAGVNSEDLLTRLDGLAIDLRDALSALGSVTGETTPDEILDVIFSSFCIGK